MATPTSATSIGPKELPIFASLDRLAQLTAKFFDKAYATLEFPASSGNMYAMPGLVLALNTDTDMYVPWVTDARHGTGSDTAVGVLPVKLELSYWNRACSPVYSGELVEAYCHQEDDDLGTIDSTVKTDLPLIMWK